MIHLYELDEDDIIGIIAEKFDCKNEYVIIYSEEEHTIGGNTTRIKAKVAMQDDIFEV